MTVSAVELALEGNLDMFVKSKKDKVGRGLLKIVIFCPEDQDHMPDLDLLCDLDHLQWSFRLLLCEITYTGLVN